MNQRKREAFKSQLKNAMSLKLIDFKLDSWICHEDGIPAKDMMVCQNVPDEHLWPSDHH